MKIKYSRDAIKFLSKLVRAWDPDFTKVTPDEARQIAEAEKSGFVDAEDIDWNNLSSLVQ